MAKEDGIKLSQTDTQAFIVMLKEEFPFLQSVHSKVLQMVNYTMWSNIKALSRLKKNGKKIGKLRFKGRGWYKTIVYNQSGFSFDVQHDRLNLSKIGAVKCKFHRAIEGKVKGIFVKRTATGKWFAIVQSEIEPIPKPKTDRKVGMDLGVSSYSTDTNGYIFDNPKFIDRTLKHIAIVQRRIARCKKRSINRKKRRMRLALLNERLTNQRNDYLHKLSRWYVDNHDEIYSEELNIKSMVEGQIDRMTKAENRTLHRHDMDASWRRFLSMLSYKSERDGRTFELIDTPTVKPSQCCAKCGNVVPKPIWERIHHCLVCGFTTKRDYNSSVVILNTGMGQPRLFVEEEPLFTKISFMDVLRGQVVPLMQEAPSSTAISS